MAQFHGFRCKTGYDENGIIVYRAICPILDQYSGLGHLEEMQARDSDVKRYEFSILDYYQVKAIDAEVADYLFVNASGTLICHMVEIEGNQKNWWAGTSDYYSGVFHPWWVEHHLSFEEDIDDYFAHHPFVR